MRIKDSALTLLAAALLASPPWAAAQARSFTVTIAIPGISAHKAAAALGCRSGMVEISRQTYTYNGQYGWDGSVQHVPLPTNTVCVSAVVDGAGGGGDAQATDIGGAGDQVTGRFDASSMSSLDLVVGGGGQSGGGGGLSGIFSGTPSVSTAIIVAGGGGACGGTVQPSVSNASFSPAMPTDAVAPGGMGFGGAGYDNSTVTSVQSKAVEATPFGAAPTAGFWPYYGGYGGGAPPFYGWSGGGGMPGGYGAKFGPNGGNPAQGGTSYCATNVENCADSPGNGGAGGNYGPTCQSGADPANGCPANQGKPGSITLTFYK